LYNISVFRCLEEITTIEVADEALVETLIVDKDEDEGEGGDVGEDAGSITMMAHMEDDILTQKWIMLFRSGKNHQVVRERRTCLYHPILSSCRGQGSRRADEIWIKASNAPKRR